MSMSIKHIKRCRRSIQHAIIRHYTGGSNTVETSKMSSKAMSLTQWKILNMIKEYITKFSTDKTFQNAINKEIAQMLQKFQPSVYGNHLVKRLDQPVAEINSIVKSEQRLEKTETNSIGNVIGSLKLKYAKEEVQPKEIVPKWKSDAPIVSKSSIMSRTSHLINLICSAKEDESKLYRIEQFSLHLQKYPEAKSTAVKEGADRVLLRIRADTQNMEIKGAINEAFALLGHVDPVPGRGIRILSIDGGGVRGILVIKMLKKLEELTGKPIYEMFDYICGVSTGAILACSFGLLQKSSDQLYKEYIDISTQIFTQSTLKGTSGLVWSHSYYNTELWEQLLRDTMGEDTLIASNRRIHCPKVSAISAVVNHEKVTAYVFRNYSLPSRVQSQYIGGFNHKIWEATRASAAAPTYFCECKLGNLIHQDGGIIFNNPTAVAIHEAKLLWPGTPIQCVVSFGTGRSTPPAFDGESELPSTLTSWKNKIMKIIDSATDTEGVHTMLNDLLPPNSYFRFNPYLTEMLTMSEIAPKKLEQMEMDALKYLRSNEDKFKQAAKALQLPRTKLQKLSDCINSQMKILGFNSKL